MNKHLYVKAGVPFQIGLQNYLFCVIQELVLPFHCCCQLRLMELVFEEEDPHSLVMVLFLLEELMLKFME